MDTFQPSYWFKKLFGFRENVDLVEEHIECNKNGENYTLKSDINNMTYNAGNFQVRYISSFLDDPKKCPERNDGTLNILCGNGYSSTNFAKIDAFSMQSLPENDGATYLAASNFNCLEFVSSMQTAHSGVTNYVHDLTQGPYTALACPQSAVLRNYFIEFKDEKGNNSTGQLTSQINLLTKTPIKVRNGYALIYGKEVERLKQVANFDWDDENNYGVGVHNNCDVLLTRGSGGCFKYVGKRIKMTEKQEQPSKITKKQKHQEENDQKEQKFDSNRPQELTDHKPIQPVEEEEEVKHINVSNHVYAASFNFHGDVEMNDFTLKIVSSMLRAEYKATIYAAWENSVRMENEGRKGARKLFLTLLGGGVFGNPLKIIANAICECKNEIIKSGLEVWVVCFDRYSYDQIDDVLMPLVKKTNGRVVEA